MEFEFKSVGFVEGGNWRPQRKTLGASREPTTNSTQLERSVRGSNPVHRGARKALVQRTNHLLLAWFVNVLLTL